MPDCVCRAEPEVFLGKGKRRKAVDSISTEDNMPSRRAEEPVMVTELFDRRHEAVMVGRLDTEVLDTGALHRSPSQKSASRPGACLRAEHLADGALGRSIATFKGALARRSLEAFATPPILLAGGPRPFNGDLHPPTASLILAPARRYPTLVCSVGARAERGVWGRVQGMV
jgi:hypothetical protein